MIRNVILYARESRNEREESEDSNVSQIEKLIDYCDIRGWNILNTFQDDYPNSKGFNRPGYNKLKKYIRENENKVDYILFVQWSKFSRNLRESLSEIEALKKSGIEPNAIEQWVEMAGPINQKVKVMETAETDFDW